MSSVQLRNKPSRNGFDLSFKNNFTAKVGELRPIMCKPVLPGDKFNINLKSFTRLQPVNTAAFARMREYFDFYFVPMELLWNKFDTVITQMKDNLMHATALNYEQNEAPDGSIPYVTTEDIAEYIIKIKNEQSIGVNSFGYSRAHLTCILLEYLGYGSFYKYLEPEVDSYANYPTPYNLKHSILPLLAYQHVYADHFRYTQWEKTNPSTFNVDYIKGYGDTHINLDYNSPTFESNYNFFDMRYCNLNKDLIFGLLPNAQYGETASVNADIDFVGPLRVSASAVSSSANVPSGSTLQTSSTLTSSSQFTTVRVGNSSINIAQASITKDNLDLFNILALRQAEALQRWKEVSQSVDEDYKSQIEAHWGVKVSEYLSHQSRYLGGTASSLDINPVVNQNITGNNGAEIAGMGTIVNNGSINFESKGEYGFIIGIYHVVPIFDYCLNGVDPVTTETDASDFPIPEFDRIGMQQLPSYVMTNTPYKSASNPDDDPEYFGAKFAELNPYLGYVPRYVNYKTSIDVARGAFATSLRNWVIPYDLQQLQLTLLRQYENYDLNDKVENSNVDRTNALVSWSFFKCNPSLVDSLFAVQADSTVDTDQLLISSFLDVKVVRNLDYNGLPY